MWSASSKTRSRSRCLILKISIFTQAPADALGTFHLLSITFPTGAPCIPAAECLSHPLTHLLEKKQSTPACEWANASSFQFERALGYRKKKGFYDRERHKPRVVNDLHARDHVCVWVCVCECVSIWSEAPQRIGRLWLNSADDVDAPPCNGRR